jgi:D-glucosaminate-6-phosphate ammonia-lyase
MSPLNAGWSRRQVLRHSGIVSALAITLPRACAAEIPEAVAGLATGPAPVNLYTRIGLRPLLNARGTYTIISGSQSLPEVKQAMFEASQYYVQMDELMAAVGGEIARLMGAPAAIVTTGCEAAIALATVACICGTDPERSQAYPYTKQRDQVIIPAYSRNPYDFGVRMSGPEIVEVESDADLRAKISERTAMIYLLSGPRAFEEPLSIKTVCAIAREKGIPVFVDAAAEEPLKPNIHLAAGATFVGYSGGKCMRGPQNAGVLLGPADLVGAAFWNAAPHHNWGRALKVGKEEAMGMLAAVRAWYERDHEAEQKQWLAWNLHIADALKGIPSLTSTIAGPDRDLSNRAPVLTITWDAEKVGITGTELVEALDAGTPRILVLGGTGKRPDAMRSSIGIMPYMMQPGDFTIVAEELGRHLRKPRAYDNPKVPSGPMAQLAGTWNVVIAYTRGTGHQQFVLSQQGGTLTGTQRGESQTTELTGKAVADQVTLRSIMRGPGYEVPFSFEGIAQGSTMAGTVHMGEYGAATFTASRSTT